MSSAEQCVAVIPCLNEARTIGPLVREVLSYLPTAIVVDDGSTDETASVAAAAGAVVIPGVAAGGKGAALSTGLRYAGQAGFSSALAMDGDGQHSAQDIPRFFSARKAGARMIIGNRMHHPRSMPLLRRVVNRWLSATLSKYTGRDLPDSQCGFRWIDLETWRRFTFKARQFEIESELIVRFVAAGYDVEFVPIETRYGSERSKIHPVCDTIRWFRWWKEIRRELAASTSASARGLPTPSLACDGTKLLEKTI